MSSIPLTFSLLDEAVRNAAAIRSRTVLRPAGGDGDKVFPPTYTGDKGAEYAAEVRKIDGRDVRVVLLDSVASQANRMELALLEGWEAEELAFPLVFVDFTAHPDLADLGRISTLQAPHRIADAILRDSTLDGTPFRYSEPGLAFTDARPSHATAMYRYCPHALVFGVWDSTGPKGGLGAKFQRALVSEIVGVDAVAGSKVQSRIDPLGIEKKGATIYEAADPSEGWTHDPSLAKGGPTKPEPLKAGDSKSSGTPSAINHGNIPPSIDATTGGVTLDHALQTTVLSLPQLRRLRFQTSVDGQVLSGKAKLDAEHAARTALAALALAGIVFQRGHGFDLRSRSLLVPDGPLVLEILGADGGDPVHVTLDRDGASSLLAEARRKAAQAGMDWDIDALALHPTDKLVHLVRKSRELSADAVSGEA